MGSIHLRHASNAGMAGTGTTLSTLAAAAAKPLKKTVADGITIERREASDLLDAAQRGL